jgi:hypothetical protein
MAKTDAVLNARRDKAPLPGPHIYVEDVAEFMAGMIVPPNDPDPENFGVATRFPNTKDEALVAVVNTNNPSEIRMYRGEQKEERLAFILHVAEKSSDGRCGQDRIRELTCSVSGYEHIGGELFLEPKCHTNKTMRTQLFFPKYLPDWVGIICSDCKQMVVRVLLAHRLVN